MQWEVIYVAAIGASYDDFLSIQYEDLVSLLQNNNMEINSSLVIVDAAPFSASRILKLVMDNYLSARSNLY